MVTRVKTIIEAATGPRSGYIGGVTPAGEHVATAVHDVIATDHSDIGARHHRWRWAWAVPQAVMWTAKHDDSPEEEQLRFTVEDWLQRHTGVRRVRHLNFPDDWVDWRTRFAGLGPMGEPEPLETEPVSEPRDPRRGWRYRRPRGRTQLEAAIPGVDLHTEQDLCTVQRLIKDLGIRCRSSNTPQHIVCTVWCGLGLMQFRWPHVRCVTTPDGIELLRRRLEQLDRAEAIGALHETEPRRRSITLDDASFDLSELFDCWKLLEKCGETVPSEARQVIEAAINVTVDPERGEKITPEQRRDAERYLRLFFQQRGTERFMEQFDWVLRRVSGDKGWIDGLRFDFEYLARGGTHQDEPLAWLPGHTRPVRVFRGSQRSGPPPTDDPGLVYRGMSLAEWLAAKKNGVIRSRGEYNLGDTQVGWTCFADSFRTASHYASGFAPYDRESTRRYPAVIVAVPREDTVPAPQVGAGTEGEHVARAIPLDHVKGVWFLTPTKVGVGHLEVVVKRDYKTGKEKLDDGSRCSPTQQHDLIKLEAEQAERRYVVKRLRESADASEWGDYDLIIRPDHRLTRAFIDKLLRAHLGVVPRIVKGSTVGPLPRCDVVPYHSYHYRSIPTGEPRIGVLVYLRGRASFTFEAPAEVVDAIKRKLMVEPLKESNAIWDEELETSLEPADIRKVLLTCRNRHDVRFSRVSYPFNAARSPGVKRVIVRCHSCLPFMFEAPAEVADAIIRRLANLTLAEAASLAVAIKGFYAAVNDDPRHLVAAARRYLELVPGGAVAADLESLGDAATVVNRVVDEWEAGAIDDREAATELQAVAAGICCGRSEA
jgi:hypothetical protein